MPAPVPILVFCGDFELDRIRPERLCEPFGWQVQSIARHELVGELGADPRLLTGMFLDLAASPDRELEIVAGAHRLLPEVPIVACVRFSDSLDWDVLMGAGAYSCLHKPLAESELRQTLGFLADHFARRLAEPRSRAEIAPQPVRREGAIKPPRHILRRHHTRNASK